ncbi:MAG: hypothetical protein H6581_16240 [Bacteroidia bacterium]|nr:hypothetical protein [Bacteroidia bacterium]
MNPEYFLKEKERDSQFSHQAEENKETSLTTPPPGFDLQTGSPIQQKEKDAQDKGAIEKQEKAPFSPKNRQADPPPLEHNGPEIEVKAGPQQNPVEMASKYPAWNHLLRNMQVQGMDSPDFTLVCARFMLAAKGGQVEEAAKIKAEIAEYLEQKKAFKSPKNGAHLWSGVLPEMNDLTQGRNTVSAKGTTVNHNGHYADENVMLESVPAGEVFNGVDLSSDWKNITLPFWAELSKYYARGIRGELHVHTYRGLRGDSVLKNVELEELKGKIDNKAVIPKFFIYANWGQKVGKNEDGVPVFEKRKREKQISRQDMEGRNWEINDQVEKDGGYWPSGKIIGEEW